MNRNFHVIFWGVVLASSLEQAKTQPPPFEQDTLADGVVSIEVEHYHGIAEGIGSNTWSLVTDPLFSGDAGMVSGPNDGTVYNAVFDQVSPRLDYQVTFNRTGTHYIVLRGWGETSNDDSCHVGINGQGNITADRIAGFNGPSLQWSSKTMDFDMENEVFFIAQVAIPSAGLHTVNIWMREDGLHLDKVILSTNPSFIPSGEGPPESLPDAPPPDEPYGVMITTLSMSNGMICGDFQPLPSIASYDAIGTSDAGDVYIQDTTFSVSGFSLGADPTAMSVQVAGLEATPMDSDLLMGCHVLNRLAYGPTPDLLETVLATGADAYISSQLAPEAISETANENPVVAATRTLLENENGEIKDMKAWFQTRAIYADRQLHEILVQFVENHFSTYFWKSKKWFRNEHRYSNAEAKKLATTMEMREQDRWREILLDPNGTFYDLLEISVRSPAMIIYLDTVENDFTQPNENYARELLELHCNGVDNGYDQGDIEEMAKIWTGWRVGPVRAGDTNGPFASLYTNETRIVAEQLSDWLILRGTNEPPIGWNDVGFVPGTNWFTGQTPVGFGDGDDNTELTDMRGNYQSVYLQKTFGVTNVADLGSARLRVYIDDGCVAYINGQEVGRVSVPGGTLTHTSSAMNREADWENILIPDPASVFNEGTNNVLALHALNSSLGNNDFSIDAELTEPRVWQFVFDASAHDSSNKVLFAQKTVDPRFGAPWSGQSYELALPVPTTEAEMVQEGYRVIDHLANLPYTMEHLCVKLCGLFVNEHFRIGNYYNISEISPEAALVRECMNAWDTPAADGRKGNVRHVLTTIFESELFRDQTTFFQKIKTPFEYVISSMRALNGELAPLAPGVFPVSTDGYDLDRPIALMGMELFELPSPDGYPEEGHEWVDTGTVNERLRWIQHLVMNQYDPIKDVDYDEQGADNVAIPSGLVVAKFPASEWNNDEAITDLFLKLIYPGEGTGNLDANREECLRLLNSDESGVPDSSLFSDLPTSTTWDNRIRSMVGLLLADPKFHDQ